MRYGWWSVILLALVSLGCNPPPKPTVGAPSDTTDNADASGTVYDEREAADDAPDVYEDEYIPEDNVLREDNLGISDLDTLDDQISVLDWDPVFFGFDDASLTDEARRVLADYARVLRQKPEVRVLLEGHCDSRGTEEYNMALGERRVQTVFAYLSQLGVPVGRMSTISYGELRPLDPRENEAAWARNRRVSFTFPPEVRN